jgi:hypothetical protein
MMGGKNLGRGVHALVLVEEPTNIGCKLPVVGLTSSVQRSGRLTVSCSYFAPPRRAARDKRRQYRFAPRNGNRSLKSLSLRGLLTTNSIPIYSGPRRDEPIGVNHRIIDPHHLAIQGGGIDTVAILAAGGAGRMTTAPKT